MKNLFFVAFLFLSVGVFAQEASHDVGLEYLKRVEEGDPPKVLHAEPLYIDLIRDLGARKGEKEWNVGVGLHDHKDFDAYEALVEYEFAPINRLGLEFELPFTFNARQVGVPKDSLPDDGMESVKLAAQYSFLVDPKAKLSMALGYIHEFTLAPFNRIQENGFTGNHFNPFLVVAKRWGNQFHTLIYTGPSWWANKSGSFNSTTYEMHTNFDYMISGTRNFIGVEFNKYWQGSDFDMTVRPQMRVEITPTTMIGIVGGIPVERENEGLSLFLRLIWEPGHRELVE